MSSETNSSTVVTTDGSLEVVSTGHTADDDNHTLAYIVVPLGALAVVVIIAFIVSMIMISPTKWTFWTS